MDVNETTCFGLLGHHKVCKSSKRLNIVCVWWMLRSHHLANKLDMRHKLCVSRYLQTIFSLLELLQTWWWPSRPKHVVSLTSNKTSCFFTYFTFIFIFMALTPTGIIIWDEPNVTVVWWVFQLHIKEDLASNLSLKSD